MKKHILLLSTILSLCFASVTAFAQNQWNHTASTATLSPVAANVGIGTSATNEAKLTMLGATKYGLYLTNTGFSNGSNYPTVTGSGIFIDNKATGYYGNASGISITNTASGVSSTATGLSINNTSSGSSTSITGIYCSNSLISSSGETAYGTRLETTSESSTATLYGIHSTVSGANTAKTYAGYFTGGKVVVMNGNVEIGTINPTSSLDVIGSIRAHEVKVCLNQGCDYVFEENYNLMPLSELSTFVKTNKHLPEVATAAEMESEGINLSEMNALLLKKIEELTLYIIQQNDEIQLLKTKLTN